MLHNKVIAALLFAAAVLFVYGVPAEAGESITVSAAISLKNAFGEMGAAFQASRRETNIRWNYASSGTLRNQIAAGAPVDVFASAALADMTQLADQGFVQQKSIILFAANTIMLIVPASSRNSLRSFDDLRKPRVARIAVGNPRTVPAGQYADDILRYFRLSNDVQHKLVLTENVRQVLDYVARAEVDAGIVYATDAATRSRQVRIVAAAPARSHRPVVYPIAVVKRTRHEQAARAFIAFVTSDKGTAILRKHGFHAAQVRE